MRKDYIEIKVEKDIKLKIKKTEFNKEFFSLYVRIGGDPQDEILEGFPIKHIDKLIELLQKFKTVI
ncbi:MAG: hypothetical protein EAX96_20885 [Candidatus Lokiarchaeota archaeon]|nr:hypothetical protein [Candidatus Lokiarchaeota archaeon]